MQKTTLKSLSILALVVGLVLGASYVYAQLASNEVYVNQAFRIGATHDGVNTTEYRLFRNTVQVATLPVSARQADGTVVFDQPGLAIGTYSYRVDAVGDGGTTSSALYSVVVKAVPTAPTAPTVLRLIRIP